MIKDNLTILGIESSCDETAASVISYDITANKFNLKSNVVASQIDLHAKFGGVFPELASRAHVEVIYPIIDQALKDAEISKDDLDGVAVTYGPGLIGSLVIGATAASTLSSLWGKPLIAVNHLEGHVYANLIENPKLNLPAIVLIVSGGHTLVASMPRLGTYSLLGDTMDDAAGEAFDKVAKLLNLGYPGGPKVSELAQKGDSNTYKLPMPLVGRDTFDFSYSGLKTAVRHLVEHLGGIDNLNQQQKADICASFEQTVVKTLVDRVKKAVEQTNAQTVLIGGGVSANRVLRESLDQACQQLGVTFLKPDLSLCTDNAVGIAMAGAVKLSRNETIRWQDLTVTAVSPLQNA